MTEVLVIHRGDPECGCAVAPDGSLGWDSDTTGQWCECPHDSTVTRYEVTPDLLNAIRNAADAADGPAPIEGRMCPECGYYTPLDELPEDKHCPHCQEDEYDGSRLPGEPRLANAPDCEYFLCPWCRMAFDTDYEAADHHETDPDCDASEDADKLRELLRALRGEP